MMKMKRFFCLALLVMLVALCSCGAERQDPFAGLALKPQQNVQLAINAPWPEAAAFFSAECRAALAARGIEVSYFTEPSRTAVGEHTVSLWLTAPDGQTRMFDVPYCGIYDRLPPTVTGLVDRSALCGEGVVLRDGVLAEDNCLGEVTLKIDSSQIDNRVEGVYEVYYTATDAAGNSATYSSSVYIYPLDVTEEMLMTRVDELLLRMKLEDKTREESCRAIYNTVQASLRYIPDADQSNWIRAAYTSLFVTGEGDCFSYFAAARALLHRMDIPYIVIQRSEGFTEDTHYWLLVNIAEDGEADRWYYFDPTELRKDEYDHSGCLLTAAQLAAYDGVRPYFYLHDATVLPPVCEEIITPTDALIP